MDAGLKASGASALFVYAKDVSTLGIWARREKRWNGLEITCMIMGTHGSLVRTTLGSLAETKSSCDTCKKLLLNMLSNTLPLANEQIERDELCPVRGVQV